ncbi:hypothetical protein B0H16DRAFT_1720939 [Mycena metata]|uniref:Uncharacterized protein n=1 Tax=Mycena metata TaxID=1033252 RepID=A0AAD7NFA8_9AGAR|nr:hypothetical protein B0H16DRAFT_1720939 [Mycena metata]
MSSTAITTNTGSDANDATTGAKSQAMPANPPSGSLIYVQNTNGYFLSRMGPTGLEFSKKSLDEYCKFKVVQVAGTVYFSLAADNGDVMALDYGADNSPSIWLNYLYPVAAFAAVSADNGKTYLVAHDPGRPDKGPYTVTGVDYSSSSISTIVDATGYDALYVGQA